MPENKLDPKIARQFLDALFQSHLINNRGFIEVRGKGQEEKRMAFNRFYPSIDRLLEDMPHWDPNRNYWFGVALRKDGNGGKKKDCGVLTALFCDVDYGEAGHRKVNKWKNREEALEAIQQFPLPPSILIHSGGGFQVYWLLREPVRFKGGEDAN